MRESIGTTFVLNFIVIFIVFVFAFLAATLSYYKAYRVNNAMMHAIEKFEGYNDYSRKEIHDKLKTFGYKSDNITCPTTRFVEGNSDVRGTLMNKSSDGYCIYLYYNENAATSANGDKATTDVYYSYGVASYLRIEIPVIGRLIRMPVFSKTYNIYHFTNTGNGKTYY